MHNIIQGKLIAFFAYPFTLYIGVFFKTKIFYWIKLFMNMLKKRPRKFVISWLSGWAWSSQSIYVFSVSDFLQGLWPVLRFALHVVRLVWCNRCRSPAVKRRSLVNNLTPADRPVVYTLYLTQKTSLFIVYKYFIHFNAFYILFMNI